MSGLENTSNGQQQSLELQRAAIDATQTSVSNRPDCVSHTVMPYEEAWFAMPSEDRYIPTANGRLLVPGIQTVISPVVGFNTSRIDGATIYEADTIPTDQELYVRNVSKMTRDSYEDFIRFTAESILGAQTEGFTTAERLKRVAVIARSLHNKRNKVLLSTIEHSDGMNEDSLLLLSDGQHDPAYVYPYVARDSREQDYRMMIDDQEHHIEDDDHNEIPLGCVALVGSLVFIRPFAFPAVNRMNSTTPALRFSILRDIEVEIPSIEEAIMEHTVAEAIEPEEVVEPVMVFDWEKDQTMRAEILPIETVDKL